jgi:class 3 adenylate cyclase
MQNSEPQRETLALKNPDREWVVKELDALIGQWREWQKEVDTLGDDPHDPFDPKPGNVRADGEGNIKKHRILQAKTLEFLERNITGHGFIRGRDGRHVDATNLRLKSRVKHRLDELDELRACLQYTAGAQPVMVQPPRRVAVIFAADVADYSRLMELDETETLARLKIIRAEIVDPMIAKGHGRICNTAGDSVLAEFPSSVDALLYASEMQAMVAERNAPIAPEKRIEYRIGIHQGDVVAEGDDLMGEVVNIAARLEGIADAGGICVSARIQEDAAGRLDVSFEDIGEPALKNISRPIRVYRVRPGRTPQAALPPTKGLIALGPEVVAEGEIIAFAPLEWQLRIQQPFVIGDINVLIRFAEHFEHCPSNDQYLVVNTIGDGRKLAAPPTFIQERTALIVKCSVLPKFPQLSAHDLGTTLALSPTGDVFAKGGKIARISGLEALPQKIRTCLSLSRGEAFSQRAYGTRLAEYYHTYRTSPQLNAIMKMEIIRQAAIPHYDSVQNREYTPLQCVERVWGIELLSEAPENHWLPVRLDLDIAGVGRKQFDIPVRIPDQSELILIATRAAETNRIMAQYVQPEPAQVPLKPPT